MELSDLLGIADEERRSLPATQVRCCVAAGCVSSGAGAVLERLQGAVRDGGLEGSVRVAGVGCMRLCGRGPLVGVEPAGALYEHVTPQSAPSIVAALGGGEAEAQR